MKVSSSNTSEKHKLAKTVFIAAVATWTVSGSLAHADNTVTAKEARAPGLPERFVNAPTEMLNMSVSEFASHEVVTQNGKPLGTIEKVVTDQLENRGEVIIGLKDGENKIIVPIRKLRLEGEKLSLYGMDQSDLEYAIDHFDPKYLEEHYKDVSTSDDPVGKYVYPGNRGFVE